MAHLRIARSTAGLGLFLTANIATLTLSTSGAWAQFAQQGGKLVGNSAVGTSSGQGTSAAISANGNTMIIGAPNDNSGLGAAWVFTRSGGTWSQQQKLIGTGNTGAANEGVSVALSGDGNTAIVGGNSDNSGLGAAWVFTRSGNTWTQQQKLVGTGNVGASLQGQSVALSADGNTAIVGGDFDNTFNGAAWVFSRSGGVWTQQQKLVGTGNIGGAELGFSASLSADGNTAIVGGNEDNSGAGAAWVFTRSGTTWSQQQKLVGTGAIGAAAQGFSVALSADSNTAIVGGNADNTSVGAAWIWTRSGSTWTQIIKLVGTGNVANSDQGYSVGLSDHGTVAMVGGFFDNGGTGAGWIFALTGGTWTQQGLKITGSGETGGAEMGYSGALSADGNTIVLGGPQDSSGAGATWVFKRVDPTNTHDFNADGVSDILWRNTSTHSLAMWLMAAGQLSSGGNFGVVSSVWSVVGSRDFNGDGNADILWLDTSGDLGLWEMNGASLSSAIGLGNVGTTWSVVGTGDFNGDGTGDILWRDTSGDLAIWLMSNGQFSSGVSFGQVASAWSVAGTGDFNGDGTTDILWYNSQTGDVAIWLMSNGQLSSGVTLGNVGTQWSVVGTGDFNGDGTSDILWKDTSGDYAIWLMNNGHFSSGATIASGLAATWSVTETGDFDGDGKSDILWLDTSGDLAVWLMNGTTLSSGLGLGNVGATWQLQGKAAD